MSFLAAFLLLAGAVVGKLKMAGVVHGDHVNGDRAKG